MSPTQVLENSDKLFEALEKPTGPLELEPRPTYIKLGAISARTGSAYMEYGNTKVIVTVEPPRELSKSTKKNSEFGVISCAVKYAPFVADCMAKVSERESFMSTALKEALQPVICAKDFTNFHLEIKVLILDDDGCALSTAINCCGVALVEAGIPTFDLITASTVCIYKGTTFVNPTAAVERLFSVVGDEGGEQEHGIMISASLPSIKQVTACLHTGYLTFDTVKQLSAHSLAINERMLATIQHVLIDKVKEHIAEDAAVDDEDDEDDDDDDDNDGDTVHNSATGK